MLSLLTLFVCHPLGFNSHFFVIHLASLYWKRSEEAPMPVKSHLAFLSTLNWFLCVNLIFYTLPTIVVSAYSLYIEYGPLMDQGAVKILMHALVHDDSYCLTLGCLSAILTLFSLGKSCSICVERKHMMKLREKQD